MMRAKKVHAHKMVAHIAEEMAQTVYEECASNNVWYEANPDRGTFVKFAAPTMIVHARQVLGEMLGRDDVSAKEKEEIFEALLADRAIPRGGSAVQAN
jgi:hypothetical protein